MYAQDSIYVCIHDMYIDVYLCNMYKYEHRHMTQYVCGINYMYKLKYNIQTFSVIYII